MAETARKYDVAFSFAGEDRAYAEAVAEALIEQGINVFYDGYEKVTLWGKNLYIYLSDLYKNQAHYCIMFLSKHYASKLWTNHERKSAQARAFQENNEYILTIRLEDTEIPGVLTTICYLTWQNETAETIVSAIVDKVKGSSQKSLVNYKRTKSTLRHPINWNTLQPFHLESFDAKIYDLWAPYQEGTW